MGKPNQDGFTLSLLLTKNTWSSHLVSVVIFFIILSLLTFLLFMKVSNDLNWLKPIAACISVGLRLKPEFTKKKLLFIPLYFFSNFFD